MRGKLLSGAAIAGIAGLVPAVSTDAAEITFSMRMTSSGLNDAAGGDTAGTAAKLRTVSVGQIVTLNLYAIVQDHNNNNDDDGLLQTHSSFVSTSGLTGTFRGDSPTVGTNTQINNRVPFNGTAAQSGRQSDLDGDGDLDVGSHLTTGAHNPFPWFSAVSNTGLEITGDDFDEETDPTSGPLQFLIGQTRFTVSGQQGTTSINFVPRLVTDGGAAAQQLHIFKVDGNRYKVDGNGNGVWGPVGNETNAISDAIALAAPVVLVPVPEPAALGLLGVGAAALLRRRKA